MDWKSKLWDKVMKKGRKQEKGITHKLSPDEITTIVATAEALGSCSNFIRQLIWDLTVAKYKLYDEIGMLLTDRYKGYGESPSELKAQEKFTRILATLYSEYTIPELIRNLRTEDYLLESVYRRLLEKSKQKLEDEVL